MNQQPLRVEGPRPSWHGSSQGQATVRRPCDAVVVVSWSSAVAGGASGLEPREVELEAEFAGPMPLTTAAWKCRVAPEQGWVDAITRSRCAEVVLTASVDDSGPARQAVLELAGHLTRQLAGTRPMVRVRFLPRPLERRRARRGRAEATR